MDIFCHLKFTIIAEITLGNTREKITEFLACVTKLCIEIGDRYNNFVTNSGFQKFIDSKSI